MLTGLLGAFAAAVLYGAATVLQAAGVRHLRTVPASAPLAARLWAGRLYAVGLGLDAAGFLASIAALRTLPLFVVQSAIASSVAVTAVLAVVVPRRPAGAPGGRRARGRRPRAARAGAERDAGAGRPARTGRAVGAAGRRRPGGGRGARGAGAPRAAVRGAARGGLGAGVRRRRRRLAGPGRARPVGGAAALADGLGDRRLRRGGAGLLRPGARPGVGDHDRRRDVRGRDGGALGDRPGPAARPGRAPATRSSPPSGSWPPSAAASPWPGESEPPPEPDDAGRGRAATSG